MSPCSASPHTWRQYGFPDSQLQRQVPQWSWVQGANLPWPAHSLKGWTLSEHQNAKDLAKKCSFLVRSKILPQSMTAPWPLLSILSVPQRERGCAPAPSHGSNSATAALGHSKNRALQRWTTARAFSTSWFSLSNPTNTHDQVQSAIKVPVTRGTECRTSEDRLPQGSQWPGPRRRPLPSSSTQYPWSQTYSRMCYCGKQPQDSRDLVIPS